MYDSLLHDFQENSLQMFPSSVCESDVMFSIAWSGREESDPDYELLADANMDRPPSQVERVGLRGNQGDQGSVPEGLETRYRSLQ
jgi:hypothetical protein